MAVHDVLVARQGTLSSSASTATPSSIILAPFLYFQPVPQAVTCEPLEFSWFYNGPDSVFTFLATNVGVPQSDSPPPLTSSSSSPHPSNTFTDARRAVPTGANPEPITITVPLAVNVPGSKLDLIWSAVTVPQGWYVINATILSSEYTALTSAFYVHTGTDTSCLFPITSTGTLPPGTTIFPLPVGGSSTGGAGTGTIIGASIGSVAFVAAIFAIWLCFLHRRRKRSLAQGGGGGDFRTRLAHRWNGLSSTDADLTSGGVTKPYQNQAHRVDSMATIQMSEEAVAAEKYSTTGKFDDDTTSNGHGLALDYLPVLTHHGQHKAPALGRTYSTSSSVSAHGVPPPNDVYASTPAPLRRASADSTTYPPSSPTRQSTLAKTQSFPTPTNSRSTAQPNIGYSSSSPISPQGDNNSDNYITSPVDAAAKQAHRQSLGRKRKPVPAYDPNEDPSSPVSPAAFQVPSVPSPSPYSTNSSPSPEPSTVGHSTNGGGGGGGHYATRSQLGQDHSQPDLHHKSSFGPGGVEGKPLHYLIPDMPMPLKR